MDRSADALGRKLLELSRLLVREDRCAEAEAALLRAAAVAPEETGIYFDLAGLRLKLGRFDAAAQALELGLTRVPDWIEGRLELARMHLRQARFAQAQQELDRLPSAARESEPALALSARLAAHQDDLPAAARLYRRALDVNARGVETALSLAEVLFRLKRDQEAVMTLRKTPPSGDASLHELSREFRRAFFAQQFDAAFEVGEKILDATRHPDPIDALRWPAVIEEYDLTYPSKQSRQAALARLARRARRRPRDPWTAYFLFVYRYQTISNKNASRLPAETSRRLSKHDQKRYGWMRLECAKTRLYGGDLKGALEDFRAAKGATEPEHWMVLCHEGELLLCLGRVEEGLAVMDRAVAAATPVAYGNALGWKGQMLLWSGRYAAALPVLEEARARGAQYAHAWIGGALLKLGRPAEALEVLERAVTLSFGDFEAQVWRAEALLSLGRFEEALRRGAETLSSGGGEFKIYLHAVAGLARAAQGDADGMRREAKKIPDTVLAEVRKRAAVASAAPHAATQRILQEILVQSRGVRRGDYALYAWLGFVPGPRGSKKRI